MHVTLVPFAPEYRKIPCIFPASTEFGSRDGFAQPLPKRHSAKCRVRPCRTHPDLRCRAVRRALVRFASDSLLEGDGFELPVPRVLEPSQFIRLLDTAFAFCRRDRRRIGDRSHLPQAERIGWAPDRCRPHTIQNWSRSLFTHLLGRA